MKGAPFFYEKGFSRFVMCAQLRTHSVDAPLFEHPIACLPIRSVVDACSTITHDAAFRMVAVMPQVLIKLGNNRKLIAQMKICAIVVIKWHN